MDHGVTVEFRERRVKAEAARLAGVRTARPHRTLRGRKKRGDRRPAPFLEGTPPPFSSPLSRFQVNRSVLFMSKPTDIRVVGARLYFLPLQLRVPLKFGTETVNSVTCARACVRVEDRRGRTTEGWGETPLSVQWVWPGKIPYELRHDALKRFS